MKVFDSLKKKAEESKKVIVFPEGNDDRIIKAAVRLEKEGIVKPLLLGKPDEVTLIQAMQKCIEGSTTR